ncbi:hypothetical protein U9M48_002757 [Paspalum notatum var. saurae]|uniref:Reverse transcriptase domain-containing protein n=1 Tax=Paspalum notatum var. saurae TaxID=547442 RepID=A0AAQ3SK35_PASNO
MLMFRDLSKGDLPLFILNFGVITLSPKVQEANLIQQYRPICLLNVSFKIFTKVATIRLNSVTNHVVNPSQTAFMKGRNILEGVFILHETVHELHRKKQNGVILKIDFEKAYNKTFRIKGFSLKWIKWLQTFLSGGSVAVNVNEEGDHLSPLLFNMVAAMLTTLIKRAKLDGKIRDHNLEMARNMKLLLCAFEQLFELKINFNKSELYCFSNARDALNQYMERSLAARMENSLSAI